jgi:methionine-rich copper-binding protein CopC
VKTKSTLLSAALLLALGISPASAHTTLIGSNPSKGSVLNVSPKTITLKFEEPLLTLKAHTINRITLSDPKNKVIALEKLSVIGESVLAQISSPLTSPGKYKVSYRVAAQDGHVVSGSYFFTLQN